MEVLQVAHMSLNMVVRLCMHKTIKAARPFSETTGHKTIKAPRQFPETSAHKTISRPPGPVVVAVVVLAVVVIVLGHEALSGHERAEVEQASLTEKEPLSR